MSCIDIRTKRVGGISVETQRNCGISLSIGLVCEIDVRKYIRVIPEGLQWITIDTSIDYSVLSNTDWNIT